MSRDDAQRRWREAEERLYPVVTTRPDLYQAAVGAVRQVADHLDGVPDLDALVTSYLASTPAADLSAAGIDDGDLPPEVNADLIRDAAYQVRSRELVQRAAVEQAQRAIEKARRAGAATCVVWSHGDDDRRPSYRRVEMALATGFAVAALTETDPDTLGPLFVLEAVQLDPETGNGIGDAPIVPREEFTDPEAWRAATAKLSQSLLTSEGDTNAAA